MEKLKAVVRHSSPNMVMMHGDGLHLNLRLPDTSTFSRGDEYEITLKKTKSAPAKALPGALVKKAVPAKKTKK